MVNRVLNHPPLGSPEFSLAYHQAIAKEQFDAFNGLTLYVVPAILVEHMLSVLGVPGRVHAGPVDGGLVSIAVSQELPAHPTQKILGRVEFLGRSRRDSPARSCHLWPPELGLGPALRQC